MSNSYPACLISRAPEGLNSSTFSPLPNFSEALARFIILQGKGVDPINLIYEASAILLISVAILLLKMRKSKLLGLDRVKEGEDS